MISIFYPQHTETEIELLSKKYRYHKHEGLGQVYRKSRDAGYTRSYESMCKQLKKLFIGFHYLSISRSAYSLFL